MKVLVASMRYDYGDKSRGSSGSEDYFERPIARLVDSVVFFDFMELFHKLGREQMNQELLATVKREKPQVLLVVPYTDQFIPEVIDEIGRHTITVGYYFDDTWRLEYSRFWAYHFTYVTTSDVNGVKRWRNAGCNNFIYSPFSCSLEVYRKKAVPKVYDVSFVGHYHPYRAWCLNKLRRAGIDVRVWGFGWNAGRLDRDGMIDVFNQTRINLNLSNCVSWDLRYLASSPKAIKDTLAAASRKDPKTREMVKARHFEINACGGFQLSYYVEGLEKHYRIGEEIALYESEDAMVDKVRYYLKHEDEREDIARRGYERTQRDHTMEKRFADLFDRILPNWLKNEKG